MGDEPNKSSNWWQTMPAVMGGIAGLMTASTGLLVAYQQLRTTPPPPAPNASPDPTTITATSPAPDPSAAAANPVAPVPVTAPVTPVTPSIPVDLEALEGRYTLTWVETGNADPNACLPTNTIDLRVDKDGEMRGSASDRAKFEGQANPDGTWVANLERSSYQFTGIINSNGFTGTYTAVPQNGQAIPCQGTVQSVRK